MQKNKQILEKDLDLKYKISGLDKNKIHILYFSYYLNLHNVYHSPLLLVTKILNFITRKPSIDHVCHISRFVEDKENNTFDPKVFEANITRGMEQNDLIDRLENFQGICYIETLNKKVIKTRARKFEADYKGVPYSKELAAMSGIDIKIIEKYIKPKNNGGFCSWLEALFLQNQKINISNIQGGNPYEIMPTDLFQAGLGVKSIFYRA